MPQHGVDTLSVLAQLGQVQGDPSVASPL